jgi:serine phosphatase RsbU (regulator of sigma subunit)
MGFASMEELQRRSSDEIMSDYLVEDEQGNPLSIDDVPSMRLMHGEQAESLLMRTVHRTTGQLSWRQLKTTPLLDDHGEFFAAVTVIEDLTAVKTAELQTRVLAESGRILASSLDYEQTLQNVADTAVPVLADWCSVVLVDEDLRRETAVVAHPDPQKLELAGRLRATQPKQIEPESAEGRVIRTGTSELIAEVTDARLVEGARDEEQLELLRGLGFRSAILVPLRVPARTIGLMTLVTAESRRQLDREDVELAEQLARRAAVAVENARLHTTLAGVAETLQLSLRPDELPEIPGWELAALYRPAGSEQRIEVGGDFYELFPAGSAWFVVIGDVTGKGVAAAALTALLRHGSRFAGRHDPHPAAILRQLDEALRSRSVPSLCTALCGRLHGNRVLLSSGGHPPALLVSATGGVQEISGAGPLLGAFDDSRWPEVPLVVSPDQLLLLYTDGVTETVGASDRFGSARLKALLADNATSRPSEVLAQLDAELDRFSAGVQRDDVAALALRPTIG